jgi:hypothetical protein
LDLLFGKGGDDSFLKEIPSGIVIGTCPLRSELVAIIRAEELSATGDNHLDLPLTRRVEVVAFVDVESELALVVSIADENKFIIQLEFYDLVVFKIVDL